MTTTLFTTWTRLIGGHFREAYDLDPNEDLDLTTDQREALDEAALTHLTSEADKILAPYGASLLGNGDIIGPIDRAGDFSEAMDDPYGIREELGMIDFDDVLEKYGNPA